MSDTPDPYGLERASAQAETLSPLLDDLERRGDAVGQALTRALASAVTGSRSLDQALAGVALRLSSLALSAGLKPLEDAIGQAVGGFTSGLAGLLARGGAEKPGAVTPFAAGGVVAAPTFFSHAGGTGLMGEAGAEAILPLRRGADGALGVALSGGAAAAPANIVFHVTTPDAESFRRSQGQIAAMLARTVRHGQRSF